MVAAGALHCASVVALLGGTSSTRDEVEELGMVAAS